MKARALKLAAMRGGMMLWRHVRPAARRRGPRGLMLGATPRDTVLMVWAFGLADIRAAVARIADLMSVFDRIVLVTDDWAGRPHQHEGLEVIVLPGVLARQRFAPDLDWETWFDRRRAQLRHDWSPDFEIDLGQSVVQPVPSG